MDYTSISEITKTIIAILQDAIDPLEIVKVSPELLRNEDIGVGFYLFHAQENSYFKNYPAPGNDTPPVNYTPMALNLHYQLSANWKEDTKEDAYEEQRLMNIAMKTLHDNSVVTTTNIGGKKINIKITMQSLSASESVQYWAAAESPVRLSAYYEVSTVFLEPEKSKSYSGRVLRYGNYVFINNLPQLTSSENEILYTVPGELSPRKVISSPAQVPPSPVSPAPAIHKLVLKGTGLGGGSIELLLIHPLWAEPALVDPGSWDLVQVDDHTLSVTVRETATLKHSLIPVDILPGLYAAQVAVKIVRPTSEGIKSFVQTSNQFPFLVAPRIDSINPLVGTGGTTFLMDLYIVQHAAILPENIQVFVGEEQLEHQAAGVLGISKFRVVAANQLELRAPNTLEKGLVPIRVFIHGVESSPHWITGL